MTIIGESGGSDKVLTLLHMPEAQGLFHRAIAISCFMPVGRITKELATKYTLEVLDTLGVSPDHLEKLQELPARYITEKVFDPKTHLWCLTFAPVADGIHLFPGLGEGYVPACGGNVPLILGSSEDEMASFDAESSFDVTEENLREKLLERGKNFGLPLTEENVDAVLAAFHRNNPKADTADHLFLKIISIKSFMGGAFYAAADHAAQGKHPVYLYVNRYDGPHGTYPERTYAGHCMDLAPAFRMVAYPQMEEYSKKITAAYGAFMRTGDPSTPELKWPKFDLENRAVMVYDKAFSVVSDPLREEREALDRAVGHKKVVDCYTSKNYKFPLNGKC